MTRVLKTNVIAPAHTHEWDAVESFDNLSNYACACGAEMQVEMDQDGTRTTIFEPNA